MGIQSSLSGRKVVRSGSNSINVHFKKMFIFFIIKILSNSHGNVKKIGLPGADK